MVGSLKKLRLTIFLSIVCWIPQGSPSTFDSYFGHLRSPQTQKRDLFTRDIFESGLTQIQNLVTELNTNRKTLEEVNREAPPGIVIAEESAYTLAKLKGEIQNFNFRWQHHEIAPSPLPVQWVLLIENSEILGEVIKALTYDMALYDYLASNHILRLILKPQKNATPVHLVLAIGRQTEPIISLKQVPGLVRLQEDRVNEFANPIEASPPSLAASEFYTEMDTGRLFYELFVRFWEDDWNPAPDAASRDKAKLLALATLGFKNPERILPQELRDQLRFTHYAYMLGVMGYRFNPGSPTTGFFTLIPSHEERENYVRFLAGVATTTYDGSSADPNPNVISQFVAYYERAAAAFKILDDTNQIPDVSFKASPLQGAPPEYEQQRSKQFPFRRLHFMTTVIEKAEAQAGRIDEAIAKGRSQGWNFSGPGCGGVF